MPRPTKYRRVGFLPQATYFKPAGVPLRALDEVTLSVEEAEAIRLKDLESLDQEESARRMNVSRSTFQRVLGSARQKIAGALLNGQAMRIEGGNFEMTFRQFRCLNGHEWNVPLETIAEGQPESCPTCNTADIRAVQPAGIHSRRHYHGLGRG